MFGVRAISCICITRFAERKGAVVFEAKILSFDLNAYSEMKTIKYLSFIPETRDLADTWLSVECHISTCGNRQETNIRTLDTLKRVRLFLWCWETSVNVTHVRTLRTCRSEQTD